MVFELRDVHDAFPVDVHVGRPLEAGPHVDEFAVGREDLDAVVLAVERRRPARRGPRCRAACGTGPGLSLVLRSSCAWPGSPHDFDSVPSAANLWTRLLR